MIRFDDKDSTLKYWKTTLGARCRSKISLASINDGANRFILGKWMGGAYDLRQQARMWPPTVGIHSEHSWIYSNGQRYIERFSFWKSWHIIKRKKERERFSMRLISKFRKRNRDPPIIIHDSSTPTPREREKSAPSPSCLVPPCSQ